LSKRNLLNAQDVGNRVPQLLNVVVAANAKNALLPVVLQTKPQQKNKLFFLNAGKPETFLIQNNHVYACL